MLEAEVTLTLCYLFSVICHLLSVICLLSSAVCCFPMTWATDHLFVAGGDLALADWADFQGQTGVSAVIVVSPESPRPLGEPPPWALLWLPLAEEPDYTLDHLTLGVQFIEAALAAGRKVVLYAPLGVHRTRPLVAASLLARGKSLPRVLREMEQRPWLPPYKGRVELLEQFRGSLSTALR